MKIKFSKAFEKKLERMAKRDKRILKKLEKQVCYFRDNVNYPSLRLHKLESSVGNLWSMSLDRKLRVIFVWNKEEDNMVYFTDIGGHDEVYK